MYLSKFKLAILVSHPIHYQASLYRQLSQPPEINLVVYYCSDFGINPRPDPELGRSFNYGTSILEGYNSIFLKNISPSPSLNHFWGLINPGICKELYKQKYDAVWVHGWVSATTWLCFFFCWLIKIPIMIRGEANLIRSNPLYLKIAKKVFLPFFFSKIKAFLAIGRLNADFYLHFGVKEAQIFSVPYAVDNEWFFNQHKIYQANRNLLKAQFGMPKEKVVILFVSKLIERKCPFDLLRAFEAVKKQNAISIFVGEGNQRRMLEEYVRQRNIKDIYFMGFRSQEELPKFFSMADIFVLPSFYEPWGMVVNEAMCFGLPVVTTDKIGAAYDLVKHAENGFVYPAGDIDKLTEYLSKLLSDNELRQKMGRHSLEMIAQYSHKEDTEGVLAALERIRPLK